MKNTVDHGPGGDTAPPRCSEANLVAAGRAQSALDMVVVGMGARTHRPLSTSPGEGRAMHAIGRRAKIFVGLGL